MKYFNTLNALYFICLWFWFISIFSVLHVRQQGSYKCEIDFSKKIDSFDFNKFENATQEDFLKKFEEIKAFNEEHYITFKPKLYKQKEINLGFGLVSFDPYSPGGFLFGNFPSARRLFDPLSGTFLYGNLDMSGLGGGDIFVEIIAKFNTGLSLLKKYKQAVDDKLPNLAVGYYIKFLHCLKTADDNSMKMKKRFFEAQRPDDETSEKFFYNSAEVYRMFITFLCEAAAKTINPKFYVNKRTAYTKEVKPRSIYE